MALGRLDVPGIVLYSGTIYPGVYKGERNATVVTRLRGDRRLPRRQDLASTSCTRSRTPPARAPGACAGQYTANTMSTVMEFIGLSPSGLNGIPAEDPAKEAAAHRTGELVMDLVRRDVRPSSIVTRDSARERDRQRRRDRWLDQRRPPPAGHRPRVRHPARHRRVRRDRRPDAAHRRHATGRPLHRHRHVRGGRRRAGHARAAQASRPPPRRRRHGRRADDRRRSRPRQSRRQGSRSSCRSRRRSSRTAASRSCAARWRPRAASSSWPATSAGSFERPGPGVRLGGGLLRRGPRPADQARRRRRDPLRGSGRRPRDAGDAPGHRGARRRGARRLGRTADRRPLLRRDARPDDRPRGAGGRARRSDRDRRGGRPDRHRRRSQGARPRCRRPTRSRDASSAGRRRRPATGPGCMAKYAALVGSASQGAVTTGAADGGDRAWAGGPRADADGSQPVAERDRLDPSRHVDDADLAAIARIVNEVSPEDPTSVDEMRWARRDLSGRRAGSSLDDGRATGRRGDGRPDLHVPARFPGLLGHDRGPARRPAAGASGPRSLAAVSERARAAGKPELHDPGQRMAVRKAIDFLLHRGFTEYERAKAVELPARRRARAVDRSAGGRRRCTRWPRRPDLVAGVHAVALEAFPDIPVRGDTRWRPAAWPSFRARDVDRPADPAATGSSSPQRRRTAV